MAFAEQGAVRTNVAGSASATDFDALIALKMVEGDNLLADMLYMAAQKWGKKQALPAIDVTNGQIGGVSVPQNFKDAASNLASALCFASIKLWDAHDKFMALVQTFVTGYIQRLRYDEEVYSAFF